MFLAFVCIQEVACVCVVGKLYFLCNTEALQLRLLRCAKCSGIKNKASIPSSQLLLRLLERTWPKKSGRGNFILKSVCP